MLIARTCARDSTVLGFHKSSQKIASEDNYSRNAFSPIQETLTRCWIDTLVKQQKKMKEERKRRDSASPKSVEVWHYYSRLASLGLALRVLICSEKEVERATGNLDFTGFLGLKKYLWYGDKSGNESSIKMSTEFCKNLIDDKWLLQFLSCYRMPYLRAYLLWSDECVLILSYFFQIIIM